MGGREAYLVAIAGVSARSLAADHLLGELPGDGVGDRLAHVARAGDAHCLIYVGPAGERVADGTAEAGGSATERLYLRRMVMCLVLELQQPFLGLSVHGGGHEDAAGVVFGALLQIVQFALGLEIAGAYGSQFHKAEGFSAAAQLLAHASGELEGLLQLGLEEGLVYRDLLYLGGESRMAAMVAPVGIQYAQLGFRRAAALGLEVTHNLGKVVGVHRQAVRAAEGLIAAGFHIQEAGKIFQRLHVGPFVECQD